MMSYKVIKKDGELFVADYESNYMNNDIIIAIQDCDFIKKAIICILELVKTSAILNTKPIDNKFIASYYDLKRSNEKKNWYFRREGTLTFGPGNIMKVFNEVLKNELDGKDITMSEAEKIFDHLKLQQNSNGVEVFRVCVKTRCDNNWLQKKGDSKPRSHSL